MRFHRFVLGLAVVGLGLSAHAGQDAAAPPAAAQNITLTLSGTVQGTFTATQANPDTGWAYELTGQGQVSPLGQSKASGTFHTLGFVATGRVQGKLSLTAPQGDVTLSLLGPEQKGFAPPPDHFDYKVTGAPFANAAGNGTAFLKLTASAGGNAPRSRKGEFTLTFGREAPAAGNTLAQHTVYLPSPIGVFHQLTVDGELGGKGRLIMDRNSCGVTEFGDPGICTKIASTVRDVTFTPVDKPDPTGQGRRLFLVDGAGLDGPLTLVVARRPEGPHRLVFGEGATTPRLVVTLEPVVTAGAPAADNVAPAADNVAPANGAATSKKFTGTSKSGDVKEALQNAIKAALASAGHTDPLAEWTLGSVAGRQGSIAGVNEVTVTIDATVR